MDAQVWLTISMDGLGVYNMDACLDDLQYSYGCLLYLLQICNT